MKGQDRSVIIDEYKQEVRRLINEEYPRPKNDFEEDERKWQDYLGHFRSHTWEMMSAFAASSDARQEFKARALTTLLIPHRELELYKFDKSSWMEDYEFLQKLPLGLRVFAAKLMIMTLLFKNRSLGSEADKCFNAWRWRWQIYGLLSALPEDHRIAQKLFNILPLNDDYPFSGIDDASGYSYFGELIKYAAVPEKWTMLADARMRAIIALEQDGMLVPRVPHEEAQSCYINHVKYCIDSRPYSTEFFADQVAYIMTLPAAKQGLSFFGSHLKDICRALDDQKYRWLRRRVIRFALLEVEKYPFRIGGEDEFVFAVGAIKEYGKEDPELKSKLEELISAYLQTIENRCLEQLKSSETYNAIMSSMRE